MSHAPTLNASLDATTYHPGDTMTLTVVYSDAGTSTSTIVITGTDEDGNAATVSVTVSVVDEVALVVSDSSGRPWTKQSDDGHTAIFTAVA